MQKYAAFEVLSADLAPGITTGHLKRATAAMLAEAERILGHDGGSVTLKTAHRHAFAYDPRPGYLYVRSRAISSRCNDNFDEFPAEEIKQAYRTFVGKPVFVNHRNDNHRRARGVIIDAALHEDTNPDGSPDTWCEVLMEVDAVNFPKLAKAILAGEIDRTSMGTDVAYSVCSFCGNKAATPLEYCAHIPKLKGQRIYRTTASGQREGVLVREICHGLGFFENSLLVEEPADPTAFFLGVEGLDVAGTARTASRADSTHPSWVLAAVSGVHYLILPNDAGAAHAALRRHIEQHHPEHAVEAMSGQWNRAMLHSLTTSGGFSVHNHLGDAPKSGYMVSDPGAEEPESIRDVYHHPERIESYYHRHEAATKDPNAYVGAWAHKSNVFFDVSRHYDDEEQAKTAARKNHQLAYYDLKSGASKMVPNSGHASRHRIAARADWGPKERGYYREGYEIGRQTCASGGHLSEEVKARMGKHGDFAAGVREGLDSCKAAAKRGPRRATLNYVAYGETLAPADVDTLRDEMCPVCGEEDAYDGERCLVCDFVKPPDVFMDPDLDAAKANDLRQEADDERLPGAGDLVCPQCGDTFQSPAEGGQPQALEAFVPPDQEGDQQEAAEAPGATQPDPAVATDPSQTFDNTLPKNKPAPTDKADDGALPETAPKEGDDCPSCGKGQLQHKDAPTPPPAQSDKTPPKDKDGDDDADKKDGDDDQDGKDDKKSKPPWLKDKKKSSAASAARHGEGEDVTMRPALAALAEQQRQIEALRRGFSTIASLAGLDQHPQIVATLQATHPGRVAAILKQADENNPAQPIPDPAPEAPAATTQETRAPDATDDPNNLGASPLTDVAPAATASPTDVGGTVLDEPLDLNEENVTAPVAGTDTLGEGPRGAPGTNRTETEVRVGDPNNPDVPFAETGWTAAKTDGRTWASLRLARLRIQAGTADGDDLLVGQTIDSSPMTDEAIQGEIETLSSVLRANARRQPARPPEVPRHLVPRAAARTNPSLAAAGGGEFIQPIQSVANGPTDEEFAFE